MGYWKMRTKECEKLFDSELFEDPFVINLTDFNDDLMRLDGFSSMKEALTKWFIPKYPELTQMEFVVLRWV